MRAALVAAVLAVPCAGADPAPGEPGTPEYQKAAELVQQLGHARFAVREAAARQLVEMGGRAVPALWAGVRSADEEVRSRCVTLIPQARATEWKRRADAYVADADGKQTHDLPFWAEWERLTGPPDAGSRALFAAMLRAEGDFLAQAAADRRTASRLCAARSRAIADRVRGPKEQVPADPGEIAAVLFVDTVEPMWIGLPNRGGPADLLRNPALADAMTAPGTGPTFRRLLARWAAARPENDPVPPFEFVYLAARHPLPEATSLLAEIARDSKTRLPLQRTLAIHALGVAGGKEAAAALAELVEDDETLAWRDKTRWGDLALFASLAMHGKKPEDFGLQGAEVAFSHPFGGNMIRLTRYRFPTAEARHEALQRWRDEVAGKANSK